MHYWWWLWQLDRKTYWIPLWLFSLLLEHELKEEESFVNLVQHGETNETLEFVNYRSWRSWNLKWSPSCITADKYKY